MSSQSEMFSAGEEPTIPQLRAHPSDIREDTHRSSDAGALGSWSDIPLSFMMPMTLSPHSLELPDSLTTRQVGRRIRCTLLRRQDRATMVKQYSVWVGPIRLPLARTLFLRLLAIRRARRDMVR